jgi:hypothetical protein
VGTSANEIWSLDLSYSGDTIAYGVTFSNTDLYEAGAVIVKKWTGSTWLQIGDSLIGSNSYEYLGSTVSLNSIGTTLAVDASDDTYEDNGGRVSLYSLDMEEWVKVDDFYGTNEWQRLGKSIDLSSFGDILFIGSPGSRNNASGENFVSVFSNDELLTNINLNINGLTAAYISNNESEFTIHNLDDNILLEIMDASGNIIFTTYNSTFYLNNLPHGAYFVRTNNENNDVLRLIK